MLFNVIESKLFMDLKSYKKFNKIILISVLLFLILISTLNFVVNPYNIFNHTFISKKLLKPEAKVQERYTKIIQMKLDKRDIDTVFIGTSRCDWAINKDYFKKITGKNAENMAMAGLQIGEYLDIIDFVTTPPRKIYI